MPDDGASTRAGSAGEGMAPASWWVPDSGHALALQGWTPQLPPAPSSRLPQPSLSAAALTTPALPAPTPCPTLPSPSPQPPLVSSHGFCCSQVSRCAPPPENRHPAVNSLAVWVRGSTSNSITVLQSDPTSIPTRSCRLVHRGNNRHFHHLSQRVHSSPGQLLPHPGCQPAQARHPDQHCLRRHCLQRPGWRSSRIL
jgi:hypothetical protein